MCLNTAQFVSQLQARIGTNQIVVKIAEREGWRWLQYETVGQTS
jgi:hypothetical protein